MIETETRKFRLLGGMDQVESSEEVIVTDTLDVLYTASSRFSNLHGFSINIKAIDINPRKFLHRGRT